MKIDEIRELGKKEIGYSRLEYHFGKEQANDRLWFWMQGFKASQKILKA